MTDRITTVTSDQALITLKGAEVIKVTEAVVEMQATEEEEETEAEGEAAAAMGTIVIVTSIRAGPATLAGLVDQGMTVTVGLPGRRVGHS